eukprot:425077-Heterocapsa_arctica.AAC.1
MVPRDRVAVPVAAEDVRDCPVRLREEVLVVHLALVCGHGVLRRAHARRRRFHHVVGLEVGLQVVLVVDRLEHH